MVYNNMSPVPALCSHMPQITHWRGPAAGSLTPRSCRFTYCLLILFAYTCRTFPTALLTLRSFWVLSDVADLLIARRHRGSDHLLMCHRWPPTCPLTPWILRLLANAATYCLLANTDTMNLPGSLTSLTRLLVYWHHGPFARLPMSWACRLLSHVVDTPLYCRRRRRGRGRGPADAEDRWRLANTSILSIADAASPAHLLIAC